MAQRTVQLKRPPSPASRSQKPLSDQCHAREGYATESNCAFHSLDYLYKRNSTAFELKGVLISKIGTTPRP